MNMNPFVCWGLWLCGTMDEIKKAAVRPVDPEEQYEIVPVVGGNRNFQRRASFAVLVTSAAGISQKRMPAVIRLTTTRI